MGNRDYNHLVPGLPAAQSLLGQHRRGHLLDDCHIHIFHQHLQPDHGYLDLPYANTHDLAPAIAGEEETDLERHLLHRSCVSCMLLTAMAC